ncbi:MAG: carboxypeptidase-like regulatory domain-containing protein [Saprospiraceae bacterium]|uniref:Carboxypeptidase-like regulatory domain-containing protein n=1 Tax=Candidatus Opimibacter skivensis TaxID=2982028 RepID=A0A9D7XND8_9BACT|nr:carboxypeptidase-like regulatory domain-containing protein [Candidatus Opimibacter skivensis]
MKSILFCLLLILFVQKGNAQGPDKIISCHFHNTSFSTFANDILQQSGIVIYYREEWTKSLVVNIDVDEISVLDVVTQAIQGSGLDVSVWNNNLVLLRGEKLINTLPSFEHKSISIDSAVQRETALTASEERYITGRKADAIQTIRIGKAGGNRNGTKAKVLGRLLDEETGEPVSYANMYIASIESGAVADINGFFTIFLKPGLYNANFEFLGYESKKYQLDILSDGSFTLNMKRAVIQMKELVIHGDRQMNMQAKDPGIEKILMKTIKNVPMMMGERNILNLSALLPGIVNTGEGSAGLNVRGGGSDQNAFYLNKIPIYNTSHLFGFFPAFNSDIIKDFSIYKGYIPAQFGGRLSSVFDINTRQGNLKHLTVHGGLSPITGNIVVEGPILKDTFSFIVSARTSYSDWILKHIKDPDIRASSAKFSDFSGGLNYDVQKTQISLFAYHSNDHFRLSDINDYTYSNDGASLTYNHRYSNSLHGEYALITSTYKFNTTDKQEPARAYEHGYTLNHSEAKADFRHILSDKNVLDYGAGFVLYNLDRGDVKPYGSKSSRNFVALGGEKGLESALYISDSYDVFTWLTLTAGFRYAMFTPLGSKTVYTYAPGSPRDVRYINDTLRFGNNKPIKWYSEPDIRVAVNLETDGSGSIKLAFNQMHQNLFMLNNTITIAPNAQWKLADYHLKPSRSNQVSLGVFRTLGKIGLETSLEVYYKHTVDYPEFKDGADFLGSPLVETAVLQGKQKAYGMEFFIKRSSRKLEGWLSYTYSKSLLKIDGEQLFEQINKGAEYPANFDIPHSLNLVVSYHLSRRMTFSSIVVYQTGKPITYPVSVYYVDGVPILDYSDRNAYRIPGYFRTDLSITLEGNLKRYKLAHSSFSLNVYNVTGRKNPYSVYFKTVSGKIRGYLYSVIGIPIVTASWNFKFGNYAAD